MIMPSNNTKGVFHFLAGRSYEYGVLGHLYSPMGWVKPNYWLPYALDNGAFGAYTKGTEWDEQKFIELLEKATTNGQPPMWVVVPDVVCDKAATLKKWDQWSVSIRNEYGIPLAFAAQDGMTVDDVPPDADIVFIGGSTIWKRENIHRFCNKFGRVHVGRINTERWLWYCHDCGVESIDGTGWVMDNKYQFQALVKYIDYRIGASFWRPDSEILVGDDGCKYPMSAHSKVADL